MTVINSVSNQSLKTTDNVTFSTTALTGRKLVYSFSTPYDIRIGNVAGDSITTGAENVLIGIQTGGSLTTGGFNTLVGFTAGGAVSTGDANTVVGDIAMGQLTTGSNNVAIGQAALEQITTQNGLTAVGHFSGWSCTGTGNVFFGYQSGFAVSSGTNNAFIGYQSGNASTGSDCTFVGYQSGSAITSGSSNTMIGKNAGSTGTSLTTGTQNTFVGAGTGTNNSNRTNTTAIGYNASTTANNQIMLGNSSVSNIVSGSTTGGCHLGSIANPFGFVFIGEASNYVPITVNTQTTNGQQISIPNLGNEPQNFLVGNFAEVTGTSATLTSWSTLVANNASLVTITLPTTIQQGERFRIIGKGAGKFKIAQNASQVINFGTQSTTTGTGGSIEAVNQYNVIELQCITANTTLNVVSYVGNSWNIV